EKAALIAAAQDENGNEESYKTEDESAWEGFKTDEEGMAEWLKKKRPERKTPAERNQVKRRKEAERREKWEKRTKEKERQAKMVGTIAREVEREAKRRTNSTAVTALNEKSGVSSEEDIDGPQLLRKRKLGKHSKTEPVPNQSNPPSLPEPPLELVLPEELRESLRLLKPEGNLLSDRFRNIMLRGKIETRRPISQPKKARRTMTEKWTHKDFRVPGEI
ncbi:MAG: hypothetical protein L6R39_006678, partial [Caloplaca ligustica]